VVIADRGQRPVLLIPARENGHIPTRDALRLGGRFRALPAPQRRALRCPG
jgi:hypothetical protein